MRWLLCFFLLPAMSWATVDRRAEVEAAYRAFKPMLKFVRQSKAFERLNSSQADIFDRIIEVVESHQIPLNFKVNASGFDVDKNGRLKMMTTLELQPGQETTQDDDIAVNLELLNADDTQISLPLLHEGFFHEISHKIGIPELGDRDQVAQFFAEQVAVIAKEYTLDGGGRLMTISAPDSAFDEEVEPTSVYRPQPTNVAVLERDGTSVDLTEDILQQMEIPSTVMRSLWAEVNQIVHDYSQAMVQMMRGAAPELAKIMRAFQTMGIQTPDFEGMVQGLGKKVQELRTLEFQDVESVTSGQTTYVYIKAVYRISRTQRQHLHIGTNGFEYADAYPAPITIVLRLPLKAPFTLDRNNVKIYLRPNLDVKATATVGPMFRELVGERRVERISIDIKTEKKPQRLFLSTFFGRGTRLVEAAKVEESKPGIYRADFKIPWNFLPNEGPLVAEALLVDSDRTIYLNRLVELSDAREAVPTEQNEIVAGSAGIWGQRNDRPEFATQFSYQETVLMVDHLNSPYFSLNHSHIDIQFELVHEEKVREVRLHFKRTSVLADVAKDGVPLDRAIAFADWDGHKVPIAGGGTLVKRLETHEILASKPEDIFRTETDRGTQMTRVALRAPFIAAGVPASPSQAYHPPAVAPIMLEVVLESGQTLTQYFGAELSKSLCELGLRGRSKSRAN